MKKNLVYFLCVVLLIISIIIASAVLNVNFMNLFLIVLLALFLGIFLFNHDNLLIIVTLFYALTVYFVTDTIGILKFIKIGVDFLVLIILFKLLYYMLKRRILFDKIYLLLIIFTICTFISSVFINKINILNYMIDFYTDYARYFIIFLGAYNFNMDKIKYYNIIKLLWYFFILQIPFIYFQDKVTKIKWVPKLPGDIRQDYLSGLLGGRGVTELGIIICAILSILFMYYLDKKVSFSKFIVFLCLFFYIFIISEIKFAIFLVVLCFAIVLFFKTSIKSVIWLLITAICGYNSIILLGKIYPWFDNFLNIETITEYINFEYAGSGLSRGNSFYIALNNISRFFGTKLFGMGIGHGTYIIDENSHTTIYKMFTISQYIYENGIIGLLLIISILITILIYSFRLMKKNTELFNIGLSGIIIIFLIVVSLFYGMSMIKLNFSVLVWICFAFICKLHQELKNS
ncbi:hypothetical protein [Turicibacter bilis]|uniref:Polymerase n=1 Tax=Turicibacter bilis TaxID=2735723 RepID=A0ABY5JKQ9_9FIRM|nr:hypothetical protein [Turicibacter bilis]MBS3200949.1 hypothetical protein [Turicibacter bilis]UUF07125.1 hypothetical protein J0J69_06450 [Turicibacter bilis]